jgi:uncharacterized membrane protein AbrB (regulator of aidB expression)
MYNDTVDVIAIAIMVALVFLLMRLYVREMDKRRKAEKRATANLAATAGGALEAIIMALLGH